MARRAALSGDFKRRPMQGVTPHRLAPGATAAGCKFLSLSTEERDREGFSRTKRRREAVSGSNPSVPGGIQPAPDADACGAMGCRETEDLFHVDVDGKPPRVLCRRHVGGWLAR